LSKSLTSWLKDIGDETVNILIDGKPKLVTKTEALARKLYLMAGGGIEEIVGDDGEVIRMVHKPDAKVAKMIREFAEGKAAPEPAPEKKRGARAGQFESEIGRRLNERLGQKPKGKRPTVKKGDQNE